MQVYSFNGSNRIVIIYASNDDEAYTILGDYIGEKKNIVFYSLRGIQNEKGVIADIKIEGRLGT